jgi:hypothetical protein
MLGPALTVGRFAMQALPYLAAAGAAIPSLREGKPLEALVQGGLGYLTGGAMRGGVQGLTGLAAKGARSAQAATGLAGAEQAVGQAFGLGAQKAASSVLRPGVLSTAAKVGIPLAGVAAIPLVTGMGRATAQQVGQTAQDAAQAALQYGGGYLGSRGPGAPNYEQGNAVPSNMGLFGGDLYGTNPLDVLGPAGMALTANTIREATAQRDAARILLPEVQAASEAAKKKEMERMMAAAGIRQNIETAANMIQRSQQSAQQMGQTAAQQMGNALTTQYQYQ